MKWISPSALARLGVLGINARNRDFVGRYNPRRAFPLVDDKLETKRLMEAAGLATPELLFVVRAQHEIKRVHEQLEGHTGFCVKPSKGSGGKGILVIERRNGDRFVKASGAEVDIEHIRRHMSNALAGLYSLGGNPDAVMVEALIEFDPVFDGYSFEGVPDIRILVFQGYPVMAMLRLATHDSDGKANLHQGAVGVGLDLGSGASMLAVQYARPVTHHPDTGRALDALEIKDWGNMLLLAARCYEITGLGYLGADLVLDRSRGAALLELNARPGLAIQVASGMGLKPRLRAIEARVAEYGKESAEARVAHVMAAFGSTAAESEIRRLA